MKFSFFFLLLATSASAQPAAHRDFKGLEKTETAPHPATLPQAKVAIPNASDIAAKEAKIIALSVSFWSLANQQRTNPSLLSQLGLSEQEYEDFRKDLKPSEKLSLADRKLLRRKYNGSDLEERFSSRGNFIRLVSKFQERFPEFGERLPEILTAWGEARGVKGFSREDDALQRAQFASVIHVLRNRSSLRLEHEARRGNKEARPPAIKWAVATQRYQFSAFEPYDPNLAAIALGPQMRSGTLVKLENFPTHDLRALKNLARVIAEMDAGLIRIEAPLGDAKTRHYLTPELQPFSRSAEQRLLKKIKGDRRLALLRIPSEKPLYLATVPHWASQEALISRPLVSLQKRPIQIPARSFVYFWGVL